MPKFLIKIFVSNNGTAPVTAHVGASLVGVSDKIEYFNTSEDYKHTFHVGSEIIYRNLTTNLGAYQKYDLYVALWEGEKAIGRGIKYAFAKKANAVEKKKKIVPVKLGAAIQYISPPSFTA